MQLSQEVMRGANFRKGVQRLYYNGVRYDSRSEIACSILLSQLLPNWVAKEGETYRVPINFRRTIDFYIPDRSLFVEYHPIQFRHEIADAHAGSTIIKVLQRLDPKFRRPLTEALERELIVQYYKKRRFTLDYSGNDTYSRSELLVCASPIDFVELVCTRLGGNRQKCLAEFKRLLNCRAM